MLIEETGSVDRQSHGQLRRSFEVKFTDSTVTSVEHRLRTLSRCYKVIVLDTSRVMKMGIAEEFGAVDGSRRKVLGDS